jgi:hypothetical protein
MSRKCGYSGSSGDKGTEMLLGLCRFSRFFFLFFLFICREDSFRSLYYRLFLPPQSPSALDHFYTVHRSPFPYTVLFIGPDGEEDALPSAIISRSNRVFRTSLQKAGVSFTMPNSNRTLTNTAAGGEAVGAGESGAPVPAIGSTTNMDLDDESSLLAARLQARKDEKQEKDEDLSAASVLLIQGRQELHALYSFLLLQDRRELHVPTLLASTPFLNGTTQQVNIVRVGAQSKQVVPSSKLELNKPIGLKESASAASSAPTSTALQSEFALDLIGPILPATAVRLFTLLQRTQQGQFQAYLSSDFPGMNLNCVSTVAVSYPPSHVMPVVKLRAHSLRSRFSLRTANGFTSQPKLARFSLAGTCLQLDMIAAPGLVVRGKCGLSSCLGVVCLQSALRTSSVSHLVGKQAISTIGALKRIKCESSAIDGLKYLVELSTATH